MVRGKYRIDSFIASGSMSNVYAATHRNGSRVALKILHKDLARDTSFAERFRREGYFGNSIVHPGIVRAIDDDMTDDGCAFLVFELLEGDTLEQKRERAGGKLALAPTLDIGDAVLDILAAAHDHQILHRDLKPDNVYITRKGEVKLLDFGVARFLDGKSTSEMTGVGIVLGTPAFMAPEQAAGKRDEVDARSDIWGVGAMLFACLTGQSVHVGGELKTKAIAIAKTKARSLKDVAPEIPRVVATVIDRALAFDKAERFADAKSMQKELGWARRSLTGDSAVELDSRDVSIVGDEPSTRRHAPITDQDDAPTMAGHRPGSITDKREALVDQLEDEEDEDDEEATEKRTRIGPRHAARRNNPLLDRPIDFKRPLAAPSEGVITSAPPVTLREKAPPSMPPSEGPTFSLRNEPVFSLRDQKPSPHDKTTARDSAETADALEKLRSPIDSPDKPFAAAPMTERMPQKLGSEPETPKLPSRPADPGALFRAALEKGLSSNDALAQVNAGLGAVPPSNAPRVIVEETPLPAAIPRAPVPLIMPPHGMMTTPGGFNAPPGLGSAPPPFGSAPPPSFGQGPGPTGPPPPDDPLREIRFRKESASARPPPDTDMVSLVRQGPMIASVTAKPKGGGWRILVPILIGILAGVGTYVIVIRQKAERARQPQPPAVTATVSASATTTPLAPPVLPLPSVLPLPASASAATSSSATPDAGAPKKKKPKPKPPPDPAAPAPEPDAQP